MTETFTFKIAETKLNPHSKQQREADVYCELCGRGIWQRNNAHVVLTGDESREERLRSGSVTLEKFDKSLLGTDSAEWGIFVGSRCAKQIPREFKVSQKVVMKHVFDAARRQATASKEERDQLDSDWNERFLAGATAEERAEWNQVLALAKEVS
jgi:hypothetical protein